MNESGMNGVNEYADSWWSEQVMTPDASIRAHALAHQNQLTKPPGSLGQLEQLAVQLAANQGSLFPSVDNVSIAIFAGDHGVVEEGVSAFPQAVTVEMIKNFCSGGAAISVLAKAQGAQLEVVNAGVALPVSDHELLVNQPIASGTHNICKQAAMSEEQLLDALELGKASAERANKGNATLYIGGEMGIGNTTSAAALAAALLGVESDALVGLGTGIDDQGLRRKQRVVSTALSIYQSMTHQSQSSGAVLALQSLAGFEMVALVGAYIRSAQLGITVLVDGFICSAAALAAVNINPSVRPWLVFAHQSKEQGHKAILQALEAEPLLDLSMRLGEGSGAAMALPLLKLACELHCSMATFDSAGVSQGDADSGGGRE